SCPTRRSSDLGRAAPDLYTQALAAVPLRTPVAGETDMTSAFGIRMHPILTYHNAYRDRSAGRPWRAGASNGHRQGDRPGITIAAFVFSSSGKSVTCRTNYK